MINIKETSKIILATFVFSAMVSFAHGASAVEIDCSGKEGYQLQICEQQKALAEKNAKSNEKAQEKASEKVEKASEQATEATKAQSAADQKRKEEYSKYNEASKQADAAKNEYNSQTAAKEAAQKEMLDAIARGDTDAAKAARDKMAAASSAAETAEKKMNDANKAKEDAYESAQKAQKEADKEKEKAQKAAEKAEKEKVKAAEKAEKNANKDLKKAQKEYDKLEKKCTKDPDKCDVEALQEARTNLEAAKANADAATKAREDADGTTALAQKLKEDAENSSVGVLVCKDASGARCSMGSKGCECRVEEQATTPESLGVIEEEDPDEAELQAYNCKDSKTGESCTLTGDNADTCKCEYKEVYTDENGVTREGTPGTFTFDELDENGNPVVLQRCYEAKDNVFKYIACKAMTTLADVRVIVYTLAGFGLIAFAFAAIFNKISWKHLANLCIALFILSMMTPFISYFTYDNGQQITYGNYLPAGFTNIDGSDVDAAANCDTGKGDVCPDVNVDTSAKDSKWSWKDLKNTVKSGINAAKTAYDTYKTVKSTVDTTVEQAKKIGTAIKNSEGGLAGILDTVGEVATASNTIFNAAQTGANAVVSNTASIANDIQTAGKSSAELKFDEENKNRINELETKLAAGNLSAQETEWAKAELEQRKAAVDSNKVTDFANNQGQKALASINKVTSVGTKATGIAVTASNAADVGATIGGGIGTTSGDTLGAIFGLATVAGESVGAVQESKQAKVDAANAEAQKQADAAAAAQRQEEIRQNNASYSQGKQWNNSFNATMDQAKPTVTAPAQSSTPSTDNKPTSNTANSSFNQRSDDAPNGTVTTINKSYYSPTQDALDTLNGRGKTQNQSNLSSNPVSNSVTRTTTVTTGGGKRNPETGEGYMPEVTTTNTVTIENAQENADGTMVVVDQRGNHVTLDKNGKAISSINYVTGENRNFENNQVPNWGAAQPSWGSNI